MALALRERRAADRAYLQFCRANPDLWIERLAHGEIIISPPVGFECSDRITEVGSELGLWAAKDGRGKACGASAQFFLPDGSALTPDTAWVSNESIYGVAYAQRRGIPYLCPEFVVEVLSPTDRLSKTKEKMERWIANGVQLGWLIDGEAQTVYVYQPNQPLETRKGILKLAGKGPVKGFTLQLRAIWDGLSDGLK